jgi:hypothetical protein
MKAGYGLSKEHMNPWSHVGGAKVKTDSVKPTLLPALNVSGVGHGAVRLRNERLEQRLEFLNLDDQAGRNGSTRDDV